MAAKAVARKTCLLGCKQNFTRNSAYFRFFFSLILSSGQNVKLTVTLSEWGGATDKRIDTDQNKGIEKRAEKVRKRRGQSKKRWIA